MDRRKFTIYSLSSLALLSGCSERNENNDLYIKLDNEYLYEKYKGKIVKFFSFTCPFCYESHKKIKELNLNIEYLSPTVNRNWTQASLIHNAMISSNTDTYENKTLIFELMKNKSSLTERDLMDILGYAFINELRKNDFTNKINNINNDFLESKLTGVPGFLIDGRFIPNDKKIRNIPQLLDLVKLLDEKYIKI